MSSSAGTEFYHTVEVHRELKKRNMVMNTSLQPYELNALREIYLDSIRDILPDRIAEAPDAVAWHHLQETFDALTPAQQQGFALLSMQNASENFLSDLGRTLGGIGRAIAPVAQIAAPIVGTMIGGPAGAMLGQGLGTLIGRAAGQGQGPVTRPVPPRPIQARRSPSAPPIQQAAGQLLSQIPQILGGLQPTAPMAPPATPQPPASAPVASSPATAQLLSLLANPQLIQSLLAQVLGATGLQTAAVVQGPTGESVRVPFAELMSTLSECAMRAASESVVAGTYESEDYLMDGRGGSLLADIHDPSERADYVMSMMDQAFVTEAEDFQESDHDNLTEWFLSNGLIP